MKSSPSGPKRVLIVTGEASGDQLGAALAVSLRKLRPDLELHGVGGQRMSALGLASFLSSGTAHATGLTEVIRHLPAYFKLFKEIRAQAAQVRPDLAVLIDNPGFNLRLAPKLAQAGIPVVGYVSPQVWAWKEGRTRTMARVYQKVLTLFDFEEDFLEKRGVRAKWVGHPMVETWPERGADERENSGTVGRIALLPGSRPHEVRSLLPIMLAAAGRIARKYPDIRWSLLEAETLPASFYDPILAEAKVRVERQRSGKRELFLSSGLALACSGTVTLECALAGLPAIVGYRASAITVLVARLLVKVKYLGMPNLLAGREIMPELLQENFTAEKLEHAALSFIDHPARLDETRSALAAVRRHLGTPGISDRAAKEILSLL